jgi:four helix bundle protein
VIGIVTREMKTHKDLDVWKTAVELAIDVYKATRSFPREELFGLSAQMRRSAVSIASNIAEGAARQTSKEFAQFLHVAAGSTSELDTQIEIARGIGIGETADLQRLQNTEARVAKMLQGLIKSVVHTRDS